MSTVKVIVDDAPVMKVSRNNVVLDIGKNKYLEDLETQGVCIAEIPADDFWVNEPAKRYHKPTEDEYELVKNAKVVNMTEQIMAGSQRRALDIKEAAKQARTKFNKTKKVVTK